MRSISDVVLLIILPAWLCKKKLLSSSDGLCTILSESQLVARFCWRGCSPGWLLARCRAPMRRPCTRRVLKSTGNNESPPARRRMSVLLILIYALMLQAKCLTFTVTIATTGPPIFYVEKTILFAVYTKHEDPSRSRVARQLHVPADRRENA